MRRIALLMILCLCPGCAAFCEAMVEGMVESAFDKDDERDDASDSAESENEAEVKYERSPEGLNERHDNLPARTREEK